MAKAPGECEKKDFSQGACVRMGFKKTAWVFGLIAVFLSGCSGDDKCDFISVLIQQAEATSNIPFKDQSSNAKMAQRFRSSTSFDLGAISITIKKEGDPQGTLRLTIHEDDVNKPDKDDISGGSSEDISSSVIEGNFKRIEFNFPKEPGLAGNKDYYFVIEFTGTSDSANFFELQSAGDVYPDGELWRFDSSETDEDVAWTSFAAEDLEFIVWKCEESD